MSKLAGFVLMVAVLGFGSSDASAHPPKPTRTYTYRVPPYSTLGEISMRLYGRARWWKKIARWNNLKPPYALSEGRVLRLEKKPTLTPAQGDAKVLEMWRRLLIKKGGPSAPGSKAMPAVPPSRPPAPPQPPPPVLVELPKLDVVEREKLEKQKAEDAKLQELAKAEAERKAKLEEAVAQAAKAEAADRARKQREIEELKRRQEEERRKEEALRAKREADLALLAAAKQQAKSEEVFGDEEKEIEEKKKNPEDPLALIEAGRKEFDLKNYPAALASFRRSRELDPKPLLPWLFEIRILLLTKKEAEAKEVGEKLVDENPEAAALPALRFMKPSEPEE